jgi:MtN3 and saliva related transmembrane protein|tara:strand:+ start:432 stop:689 length:258 start_codon:yes stop_codon:yes gene_type:complete
VIDHITVIGLTAGGLSIIAYIPQVWKTYTTKRAKDLSMKWLILTLSSAMLWFAYGVLTNAFPLAITSCLTASMNTSLIVMKWKYE